MLSKQQQEIAYDFTKIMFHKNIVSSNQLWLITPNVFPLADCDLKPMQL